MPAILLDGSQGAVEFEPGKHGFDQVFKTVAASDSTGFRLVVFGPANVLLICIICCLGCTSSCSSSSNAVISNFFGALGDLLAAFLGGLVCLGLSCFFRFLSELVGL